MAYATRTSLGRIHTPACGRLRQRAACRRPFQRATLRCQVGHRATESSEAVANRRQILLTGGVLLGTPLWAASAVQAAGTVKVENLSSFQKADERAYYQGLVIDELAKTLTADDASDILRLALHDAGTYDSASGTGGFNGSIQYELDRPENKGLKGIAGKLLSAKKAIDAVSAKQGAAPISFVDLEVAGGKVAFRKLWLRTKIGAAKLESGGQAIADRFGADWDIRLGRDDAEGPDPEGRIPAADASVEDIKNFLYLLGNKNPGGGGFGTPKPPFWEKPAFVLWPAAQADPVAEEQRWVQALPDTFGPLKAKYDRSRKTVTRTDYEVDFIDYFTKLTNLTTKPLNSSKYLFPIQLQSVRL